jgi:hypothetical protein
MEEVKGRVEEVDEKEVKTNDRVRGFGPEILRSLMTFDAVSKYKSVARAMRRGDVTKFGIMTPKRPFNNRANTSRRKGVHSRVMNEYKKSIYGRLTGQTI